MTSTTLTAPRTGLDGTTVLIRLADSLATKMNKSHTAKVPESIESFTLSGVTYTVEAPGEIW